MLITITLKTFIQIILKMQNEKVSKKIKSSYLVIAIFSKKYSNSKRPKRERTPPVTQIDVRCMQPRFENSPCCARSGLTQTDIPLQQLRCTSGQGAGPRFGWNKPIYLYSRCYENCLCRVTSL